MKKYQVWIGGCDLFDCHADNEKNALTMAKNWLGHKLPKNTSVNEIPEDYYINIVRLNKAAGFHAGNL